MANSDKNIRITTSRNKATLPSIVFTGSSAGTSVLTLEVRDDNSIAFTGLDGDVFSLDYDLSSGTIWSVNDKTGVPFLRTSFNGLIGLAEFGGTVGIGQTNPLYKLDVKGQVGFASTNDNSYSILIDNVSAVGSNSLQIRSQNDLRFYNTGNTFYTGFQAGAATANTTYTWPLTSPASGTSVLQSDTSGTLSWVAVSASGGGAGTVASGTANQVAIYAATGASVSGAANLTYNTTSVTVANTTASTNNSSGALLVYGGIGASGQISGAGASFTSTVFLNGIQIGQGGNNININDSAGTTIANFNTSNGWFRSAQTTQSTSSATGALVSLGGLGVAKAASIGETVYALSTVNSTSLTTGALVVSGGAGFAKTIFVGDNINIFKSGSVGALRLWNSAQTQYTGLQAGNPAANTTYTLPIAFPGSGTSVLTSDTSGTLTWGAAGGGSGTVTTLTAGSGISFSTGSTITTTGTIRQKRFYRMLFMSGYTPNASGVDTVVMKVPDNIDTGASDEIYNCREVFMRVETANAGTSTINVQKYGYNGGVGVSAFSTTSAGSTTNILSAALSISGATTHEVGSSTFAAGHGTVGSGDKLRVNFTALNASHISFTISLLIEEQ